MADLAEVGCNKVDIDKAHTRTLGETHIPKCAERKATMKRYKVKTTYIDTSAPTALGPFYIEETVTGWQAASEEANSQFRFTTCVLIHIHVETTITAL